VARAGRSAGDYAAAVGEGIPFGWSQQEAGSGMAAEVRADSRASGESRADREAGVKLCEHCYGRGVREDARESGVV